MQILQQREREGGATFPHLLFDPPFFRNKQLTQEVMPALLLTFLKSLIEGVYTVLIIMECLYMCVCR